MTFEAHWAPCVCQPKDMQDLATLHATQFAVDLLYILLSLVTGCAIMLESTGNQTKDGKGNKDEIGWTGRMICFEKAIQVTSLRRYNNLCQVSALAVQEWPTPKHQRVEVILRQKSSMGLHFQSHRKMAPCTPNTSLSKKLQTPFSTAVMLKKSHWRWCFSPSQWSQKTNSSWCPSGLHGSW